MANGVLTDHDMIVQMHTELLGLDGESGMVKEHKENIGCIAWIKRKMVSKEDCLSLRKNKVNQRRNVWLIIKDILLILLAIAVFLFGRGIL